MLRHVGYVCLVVAFVAFAYYGLIARARTSGDAAPKTDAASRDELRLEVGVLTQRAMHMEVARGYPWPSLRGELATLKRGLPPDPGKPTAEESRDAITRTVLAMRFKMPTGPLSWDQVVDALRERYEPKGVKVLTGPTKFKPPEGFRLEFPDEEWTGFRAVSFMYQMSQQMVGYQISSEGICVGTDFAVNYEMREAQLIENRRRVAAENAEPVLDAEFRPDFVDATVESIARFVQAQTGVDLVADPEMWGDGIAVRWRGEPRKLRDSLDQLALKLHAYWRYKNGRVWLLKP
jgi:hypothetical protein